MKKSIFILTTALMLCCPLFVFSNLASINGNVALNVYNYHLEGSRGWGVYSLSMDNFSSGEKYKIIVAENAPQLIENLEMSISSLQPNLNFIASGESFTFNSGDLFHIGYDLLDNAQVGQIQLLQFFIYKKTGLFNWEYQTTFYLYINITCQFDLSESYIPAAGYEILNTLSVSGIANPNGGLTKLDAGLSVTLLPGFSTNLSGGGSVLILNDGCGGAYRLMNPEAPGEIIDPRSIQHSRDNEIRIYPNPTQDQITISIPSANINEEIKIEIRDIHAKLLYSENKLYSDPLLIDLKVFKPGFYLIHVTGFHINHNQKLIKE